MLSSLLCNLFNRRLIDVKARPWYNISKGREIFKLVAVLQSCPFKADEARLNEHLTFMGAGKKKGAGNMRYWVVCCNVGHCGTNRSRDMGLAIEAKEALTAMSIARRFPGVKHHGTKYFSSVHEITEEEYRERRKESAYTKALRN